MKKILSVLLPIILLLTPNLTVFASDTIINSEGSQAVPITADVVATFEITVPSAIHITDFDETEFLIKGTGNISKYEYLSVDIPNTVNMTCVGEYSENLPITKSSDRFLREELMSDEGGTITCSIDSSTLPSGSWIGSLDINVSVKDLYYRLPDTINYTRPYTTVTRDLNGTIQIWNHERPLYYYEPDGSYSVGTLNAPGSSSIWFSRYEQNSEGVWSSTWGSTFSRGMGGSYISCNNCVIVYTNYVIYNHTSGEVWLDKQCPD